MTMYRFTPEAFDDLLDMWKYIAAAADRVESAIHEACARIALSPLARQQRKDLTTLPLRFWILARYPSYLIVYDPSSTPLQIIRILHGVHSSGTLNFLPTPAVKCETARLVDSCRYRTFACA